MGALAGKNHAIMGLVLRHAPRILVTLDKQPGIRPLGIDEAWMCAVSKLVLMQCRQDGKEACGNT